MRVFIVGKILPGLIHLLSTVQHGFVRGRSCVIQLLTFLHDLGASLDAGDEIVLCFQMYKHIQISNGITRNTSENLNLFPILHYRTSLFRDSFFNRIVKLWNSLPLQTPKSPTFNSFKTNLYKHYFSELLNILDTERLNTWKTICPYRRSVNSPFTVKIACSNERCFTPSVNIPIIYLTFYSLIFFVALCSFLFSLSLAVLHLKSSYQIRDSFK